MSERFGTHAGVAPGAVVLQEAGVPPTHLHLGRPLSPSVHSGGNQEICGFFPNQSEAQYTIALGNTTALAWKLQMSRTPFLPCTIQIQGGGSSSNNASPELFSSAGPVSS